MEKRGVGMLKIGSRQSRLVGEQMRGARRSMVVDFRWPGLRALSRELLINQRKGIPDGSAQDLLRAWGHLKGLCKKGLGPKNLKRVELYYRKMLLKRREKEMTSNQNSDIAEKKL